MMRFLHFQNVSAQFKKLDWQVVGSIFQKTNQCKEYTHLFHSISMENVYQKSFICIKQRICVLMSLQKDCVKVCPALNAVKKVGSHHHSLYYQNCHHLCVCVCLYA